MHWLVSSRQRLSTPLIIFSFDRIRQQDVLDEGSVLRATRDAAHS